MTHHFLKALLATMTVCGPLTAIAQTQQQPNCGCQCKCETCTCPKPGQQAGGHWVWVADDVTTPISQELNSSKETSTTTPSRTQRTRPSTHKNEGEISLTDDNTVTPQSNKNTQTKEKAENPQKAKKSDAQKPKTPAAKAQPGTQQQQQKAERTPEEEERFRELMKSDVSKYDLVQYVDTIARHKWVDDEISDTEEDLMEFVKHRGQRYMPASASMDHSENAAYLYFDENIDGTPGPLHLRIQYYADDPLRYNDIDFQIDYMPTTADDRKCTYNLHPENIDRGNSGKMYWETSDNIMKSKDDKDLLYALAHCNWALLTFKTSKSDNINQTRRLTDDQLRDFYVMLQLFRLKGGVF